MKLLLKTAMYILATAGCAAAQTADLPKPHLDKTEWTMLGADLGIRTIDTIQTREGLTNPCKCFHEASNFQFIVKTTPGLAAYDVAVPVFYWFVTRELTRHHHPRWAHVTAGMDIAVDLPDVIENVSSLRGAPKQWPAP